MALLEVRDLSRYFGGLAALNHLDLDVFPGEIMGVIGPNGAGKSTLFNVISGVYPPTMGKIAFQGEDITGLKAHQIASKGIIRTFQANVLFEGLSVAQHVMVACYLQMRQGFWASIFNTHSARQDARRTKEIVAETLQLCGLTSLQNEAAKRLPHGHQRIVGFAMALAAKPKLLLLDEPFTGLNAEETQEMIELLSRVKSTGVTSVIVEHNMKIVMSLCERISVLNFGEKLTEGSPAEIQANPEVIKAYLGGA